jgi:UDP-glucose 4-epimerase
VGGRMGRGVIRDFILKLERNPRELEILGDGMQTRSYILVDDCVEAVLMGSKEAKPEVEIFNVGSEDSTDVRTIANIVCREMNLKKTELKFNLNHLGRGWKGDIKRIVLDIKKIKNLGFQPKYKSIEAVKMATQALLRETHGFKD